MEMMRYSAVRMTDASKTAEVRRIVQERALALGWAAEDSGRAALVATEIATNLIKHAQQGTMNIDSGIDARGPRLQIAAVDHGPGIEDVGRCLQDGYSTAGSPGTGLGAIKRLTSALDLFSNAGKGTVIVAEVRPSGHDTEPRAPLKFDVGGFSVPRSGESQNGDAWDFHETDAGLAVLVCDGLGHGASAAEASARAVETFRAAAPVRDVKVVMSRIHEALRQTRGAAASLAVIDIHGGLLTYCGIGNITGAIVRGSEVRHLVSHNGILGHVAGRVADFTYPWTPGNFLIMHSDGLTGRWRPEEWPGLWVRPTTTIAGVLYRDMERGRDDATVMVARAAQ
jgi:anti-sigma regulatory factor (Ser/Thr protein kinase)